MSTQHLFKQLPGPIYKKSTKKEEVSKVYLPSLDKISPIEDIKLEMATKELYL